MDQSHWPEFLHGSECCLSRCLMTMLWAVTHSTVLHDQTSIRSPTWKIDSPRHCQTSLSTSKMTQVTMQPADVLQSQTSMEHQLKDLGYTIQVVVPTTKNIIMDQQWIPLCKKHLRFFWHTSKIRIIWRHTSFQILYDCTNTVIFILRFTYHFKWDWCIHITFNSFCIIVGCL